MQRSEIINKLIKKCNFKNYLEIGIYDGDCFNKINCEQKTGVDPDPILFNEKEFVIEKTSDDFFKDYKGKKFDIIFIDGLHHSEQVTKDIENALINLTDDGIIVLHDALPQEEVHQIVPRISGNWTGDVWKSIYQLKITRSDIEINTINTDWGCVILRKKYQPLFEQINEPLDWHFFCKYHFSFLNVQSVEWFNEFVEKL